MIQEIKELFTVQQLAELLHKQPSTIYSDINRRPSELPPIFRASRTSKPLFVNPRDWVLERTQNPHPNPIDTTGSTQLGKTSARKRGRPSNVELQRRMEEEKNGGAA